MANKTELTPVSHKLEIKSYLFHLIWLSVLSFMTYWGAGRSVSRVGTVLQEEEAVQNVELVWQACHR